MTPRHEKDKAALIENVIAILAERMTKSNATLAVRFVEQSLPRIPLEELQQESPETLATIVGRQLRFMDKKSAGQMLIRIFNPSPDTEGWDSDHTVIEIVNDDQPFLVDSSTLALSELGLGIHLIVHPVIRVSRDAKGRLKNIYPKQSTEGHAESFMHFQVDRSTDPEQHEEIRLRLERCLEDARLAFQDWRDMEGRALDAEQKLAIWSPQADDLWLKECRQFIRWLLDDHFIFLGTRDYEVIETGDGLELRVIADSGLGILRESRRTVTSRPLTSLATAAWQQAQKFPMIITKTNARSTVHRSGYMDYIGVLRFDDQGRTIGERRFLGLFTSMAYNLRAMDTPVIRVRAKKVLDAANLREGSHAWKSMMHILETLPRDELFQASSRELLEIATGVLNLHERQRVRLLIRRERYGRFYSCLVYLPREHFNTENREKIQKILKRGLKGGRLDYSVHVAESRLARLRVIVRPKPGAKVSYDAKVLEQKIIEAVRSWSDELREALVQRFGEEQGLAHAARLGRVFPEAYKEDVSPRVAAFDVENVAAVDQGADLRMSLYRPRKQRRGILRFKVFRQNAPIPLSDVLPMLEDLGLRIVNERPYELRLPDERRVWIQDFDMIPAVKRELDLDIIREHFQEAFEKTLRGETDSDALNRLVIAAQMHWRQVKMLRAYCKYLLQTGIPFSLQYMAETLGRYPAQTRLLVELFEAAFDPDRDGESDFRRERGRKNFERRFGRLLGDEDGKDNVFREYVMEVAKARENGRAAQIETTRKAFRRGLQSVTSLDEDRILFAFYEVINATLRTNFFQAEANEGFKNYLSFKLDSQALPDLPRPRPFREIWVFSPRFEGIHLRAGKIARGGLRWSDRREDFRTEVLGLMKAQNVKNTMIVPVGAKGGFVVKKLPEDAPREEVMAEVVSCYSDFIHGLLDITDNLDLDKVIPPAAVVRRDEDDPYLVVAADKGTATFSDTANGIAEQQGFWLGDAFASGGSLGYDHKAMGITARGTWEGVMRHFRELGKNIQREPFTVVGIGDMSGDVFGNGMLLSRHIRLQAAFNHLHIFLDPVPDEKAAYRERRRLFRKLRSSWKDYKPEIISRGGGVFSRQDKTIPISPEVREWLGIEAEALTPNALIRELLKAPVDLLWNGGIGTYVKAASEAHADVGDLANNAVRVDGQELRCKVVAEGGNLGLTQLGRIEFALAGGRVNTDFIDNSAGVDTSDHEVNIKILLNQAMRAGLLDFDARNSLLASMTDEVAALVLRSNYLQTQALSIMERLSVPRLGSKQHFINVLEHEGKLDRNLEYLPDEEELTARRKRGEGMCRPELAVLLSYSKIALYQQLLASDVPEDDYLSRELAGYFPTPLRERFSALMQEHRLKREIIATQVTNSVVNRMGASFALRMHEDTGATPDQVARAYTIAREVFDARSFWVRIDALDNRVDSDFQIKAMLSMWNLLRQATRWLLNLPGRRLDIQQMVKRLAPGLSALEKSIRHSMSADEVDSMSQQMQPYLDGGFSKTLAERTVMLERLFPALDVVETAARRRTDANRVAEVFFGLGNELELKWLRRQVESLVVHGQWHALSRANLRDELFTQHNMLVERVLEECGRKKNPVASWTEVHQEAVDTVRQMLNDMKGGAEMDYATVSVAVRALSQLVNDAAA
ncbi:MAG: NAD-glutamate dehydrogenase [Xanthomonadales bacterium]|nr:NAD-glutamate dehydrogenase [Xanthomonadales bacterium]